MVWQNALDCGGWLEIFEPSHAVRAMQLDFVGKASVAYLLAAPRRVRELPVGDWIYEMKFDGYRALAFKEGEDVCLLSRNKKAFAYSQLLDA